MTKPVRLQLSRRKGFDLHAHSRSVNGLECVSVARPGPWGNPFVVGLHGTAAECVDYYRALLAGLMRVSKDPDMATLKAVRDQINHHGLELKGKNLACWCRAGAPCHADVLLHLVNEVAA
ncbi:DUF4326 domain-containing protein [Georhizobium profundi]|uniref:DUF4326 domain-containing protein n=1 Tax=Georhizobium profundi TaxID=2341112 RepID=A0A3S9B4X2_9HYPH|nr:DUF4326 domain-containing protein [Georhizobium profundi]AZN71982.1 DUF4326 domain-containing protein [Georhizobium profundi]